MFASKGVADGLPAGALGVALEFGVPVPLAVAETFGVAVAFGVPVGVALPFGVPIGVALPLGVPVGVALPLGVPVGVALPPGVPEGVPVDVAEALAPGVGVAFPPQIIPTTVPVNECPPPPLASVELTSIRTSIGISPVIVEPFWVMELDAIATMNCGTSSGG